MAQTRIFRGLQGPVPVEVIVCRRKRGKVQAMVRVLKTSFGCPEGTEFEVPLSDLVTPCPLEVLLFRLGKASAQLA